MRSVIASLTVLTLLACAVPAGAGGHGAAASCCAESYSSCDCASCGQKTCQVVCGFKEVKKTVWVVKCEEFCVPNPRCPIGCHKSTCACAACGESCEACAAGCASRGRCLVPPKCGPVRCRKKLIKKEITCKVPVYKCVVCGACGEGCGGCAPEAPMPAQRNQAAGQPVRPAPPLVIERFSQLNAR